MTGMKKACRALFVLTVLVGFGCTSTPETNGGREGALRDTTPTILASLTDRVWARTDSVGLPGPMRVFLGNGTLLIDSCWETYRLCQWRLDGDSSVVWQEDGVDIRAALLRVDAHSLVLRLDLADGPHEEHYAVAPVPYTCPDMKR
jgi:hypothetical protein